MPEKERCYREGCSVSRVLHQLLDFYLEIRTSESRYLFSLVPLSLHPPPLFLIRENFKHTQKYDLPLNHLSSIARLNFNIPLFLTDLPSSTLFP